MCWCCCFVGFVLLVLFGWIYVIGVGSLVVCGCVVLWLFVLLSVLCLLCVIDFMLLISCYDFDCINLMMLICMLTTLVKGCFRNLLIPIP